MVSRYGYGQAKHGGLVSLAHGGALGNGNTDEGAKVMDKVVKHVRKKAYGTTKQQNEISGLKTLEPMMERV